MSVTSDRDHVEAVIDLLENAADTAWSSAEPPTIKRYWDDAQQERGPGAGQPPTIYVWSPTDTSLEQFSIDGDQFEQRDVVELLVYSLDSRETELVQSDVTRVLSEYLNDNKTRTPFATVEPVAESDFRSQKQRRLTDHYVQGVQVEPRGLSDTGLA